MLSSSLSSAHQHFLLIDELGSPHFKSQKERFQAGYYQTGGKKWMENANPVIQSKYNAGSSGRVGIPAVS